VLVGCCFRISRSDFRQPYIFHNPSKQC